MAFKMNRPLKMNGPRKSGLNFAKSRQAGTKNQISGDEFKSGETGSSGIYYNSDMGPMKMVSPSALKQAEEGYVPNEEDSKRVQEGIKATKEKAAKNDWETGSTLEEGDYATYGQTAYDFKGNVIKDFQGHESTGPVIMNQNGRPYSEQEGTDELIFWAPLATDKKFPGGEEKSERDKFNDQETKNEMEKE
tara:strand:- start:194 stop:766 length:573 start_codon:yes stop_codon:yes gene_type:complete